MTEVTPNLPHLGNFCKYCFMGTLLQVGPVFQTRLRLPYCRALHLNVRRMLHIMKRFFLWIIGVALGVVVLLGAVMAVS